MNKNKTKYELKIVSSDIVFLKALEYSFEIALVDGSCKIEELKE